MVECHQANNGETKLKSKETKDRVKARCLTSALCGSRQMRSSVSSARLNTSSLSRYICSCRGKTEGRRA